MKILWTRSLLVVALVTYSIDGWAAELPDPLPCGPCFFGELKLKPNETDVSGKTKVLLDDLYFIDPDKFVWKAGKGDVTDGASIPDLFKPIIGGSFEPAYLPAAIIHDHYTSRSHRVRSWRDTARAFYQAMLVNGVDVVKAKTMYFAVYAFGPHWGVLAQGVPCGKNCVFTAPVQLSAKPRGGIEPSTALIALPQGHVYAEEGADLTAAHAGELEDFRKKVEASELRGTPLSLKDIETIAKLNHGDNVFLHSEMNQ